MRPFLALIVLSTALIGLSACTGNSSGANLTPKAATSLEAYPISSQTRPNSLDAYPASLDAYPASSAARPASLEAYPI